MNELLMRVNYYNNWHHFSVQSIQEEMIGRFGDDEWLSKHR